MLLPLLTDRWGEPDSESLKLVTFVCATYLPKDLLDSFVDSHQNVECLGKEPASCAGTTTAMDNTLVEVSLKLLTEA